LAVLALTACAEQPGQPETILSDVTEQVGIDFVHTGGVKGDFYFPEIVGPGAALFDYDNDGDLDLYLVQSGDLALAPDQEPRDRLFRNDLENGELKFTEVTDEAGIDARGFGKGVAAGDVNNDGWVDLYVTNVGSNQLWLNNGDGTFTDVTESSGTDDPRWSSSATFFDYDRDGWLDLMVLNYVVWSRENQPVCRKSSGARDYCGPNSHKPTPDKLFHNLGDGRFEDVTISSRIAAEYGAGLGVVATDLDQDGWQDLYVANDQMRNTLWMNRRDGTFENTALMAGAAVNRDGQAEASMGLDVGDVDNDGDMDLFMTHLKSQTNTLYANRGDGIFEDITAASGLAGPSVPTTGFGMSFLDLDNDGWLDVVVGNGRVSRDIDVDDPADLTPYLEANQLYLQRDGAFVDVSDQAGPGFVRPEITRGLAVGDIDNDGDPDVVICNNTGPTQIFINNLGGKNHWVGLRLMTESGRDDHAAQVFLETASGRRLLRQVRVDGSYLSANDPRVLFGLAGESGPVSIEVHWVDGRIEAFTGIPSDQYTTVVAGTGEAVEQHQ